jgi:hypothetical protein
LVMIVLMRFSLCWRDVKVRVKADRRCRPMQADGEVK